MKSIDPYLIKRWSEGYFSINENGHVAVHPGKDQTSGDLYELTKSLVEQGIEPPILIRFNGILRDRIHIISKAFLSAIAEFNYTNTHHIAFPIKVNPQKHVVETVQQAGLEYSMGLEVGSKPELIAMLAIDSPQDSLLLCNGYKDAEYISLALMAKKLGKRSIIIIEQPYELKLVLDVAEKMGVEAEIGFRMKLSNKGSGRWESSGGDQSKFGLYTYEIVDNLSLLESHGKSHWLKLLHFHVGSQITSIESIKLALNEAARMYTEIAKEYPSLCMFDVGGGLAVDYDGSKSKLNSSMNYSIEEYARNIVSVIGDACKEAHVKDPVIITESGRATVAHHAVLIVEVTDVTTSENLSLDSIADSNHPIIETLSEMLHDVNSSNCREFFHDVMEMKQLILEEFVHGKFKLKERATAEKLYRMLLKKIYNLFKLESDVPDEIETLEKILLDIYFCNFSVFQSLPDSWAIDQLFPIMPIHRLNETVEHRGILADLSCDSDGKINRFIGKKGPESILRLNPYNGESYYIGIFLVGAYQEILGALHNLFGDTNVVHAELDSKGNWQLSKLVEGDTIEEVLSYVQYNAEQLKEKLHLLVEQSIKSGRLSFTESAQVKKKYKQALESYTYLVE